MREQQNRQAAPRGARPRPTRRQRLTQILLLVLVVLILAGIWTFRVPKNYVNLFLDHYDGSTSVVSELKGRRCAGCSDSKS